VLLARGKKKNNVSEEEMLQGSSTVAQAVRAIPPEDTLLLPRVRRLLDKYAPAAIPTSNAPLESKDPFVRIRLTMEIQKWKTMAPGEVRPHPAAKEFPGAVSAKAPRVEKEILINRATSGWHSTGLYAAPGEKITIHVPEEKSSQGMMVRIGAHSDMLWEKELWRRCPDICIQGPLVSPKTEIASAFGGLLYIVMHRKGGPGKIPLKICGAVKAPHFVLGRTSLREWRSKIRRNPAPWAELESDKVILTVPSTAVRKLDDPKDLMRFWDSVLDCCAELAALPLNRSRPERYVTDVQISAGYMHSGYPIMTLLDMPPVVVDRKRMMANGHGGVWGLFHEMGHNHQSPDWTFQGAGEVTVNLFTLYVFQKACGLEPASFEYVSGSGIARKKKEYLSEGRDFAKWKKDPFLALQMYVQMQEAFGWIAFRKIFKEYKNLHPSQRPKTDNEKRDQWLVRFSKTVNRNLGPFFEAWGVPTSEEARTSIAHLPPWLPKGFPRD